MFRHLLRSMAKSALSLMVAALFVFAIGWLSGTIDRTEIEIDRLYDTVIVDAGLNAYRIFPETTVEVIGTGFVRNEYLVAAHTWSLIVPAGDDGAFPEEWEQLTAYDDDKNIWDNQNALNPILATNDMRRFATENSASAYSGRISFARYFEYSPGELIGEFEATFAADYGESDFSFDPGRPVPVIIPETFAQNLGIGIGGEAYINHTRITDIISMETAPWEHIPVTVVGTHNRNIIMSGMRDAVIIPLPAMTDIFGDRLEYAAFSFEIEPAHARDIAAVRDRLKRIAAHSKGSPELFMHDEELRVVVSSMEKNLSFLRLMRPAAVALSLVIGLSLSILLMLQNAKRAAIMRVLGTAAVRSRIVLCAEQLIVCAVGLAAGMCAAQFLEWDIGALLKSAGLYLAASVIGSAACSIFITSKPPLALLQVRE